MTTIASILFGTAALTKMLKNIDDMSKRFMEKLAERAAYEFLQVERELGYRLLPAGIASNKNLPDDLRAVLPFASMVDTTHVEPFTSRLSWTALWLSGDSAYFYIYLKDSSNDGNPGYYLSDGRACYGKLPARVLPEIAFDQKSTYDEDQNIEITYVEDPYQSTESTYDEDSSEIIYDTDCRY